MYYKSHLCLDHQHEYSQYEVETLKQQLQTTCSISNIQQEYTV